MERSLPEEVRGPFVQCKKKVQTITGRWRRSGFRAGQLKGRPRPRVPQPHAAARPWQAERPGPARRMQRTQHINHNNSCQPEKSRVGLYYRFVSGGHRQACCQPAGTTKQAQQPPPRAVTSPGHHRLAAASGTSGSIPPSVNMRPTTCASRQARIPTGSVRRRKTASGTACGGGRGRRTRGHARRCHGQALLGLRSGLCTNLAGVRESRAWQGAGTVQQDVSVCSTELRLTPLGSNGVVSRAR